MNCRFLILLLAATVALQACRSETAPSVDYAGIIASYSDDGQTVDCMKVSLLNLALAETGQLAERVFHYTQAGSDGILPPWNMTVETGERLSDVYWSMGHVALAQRMAFEANVLDDRAYNPRMMQRLIETNLTYGAYDAALKDIIRTNPSYHKAVEYLGVICLLDCQKTFNRYRDFKKRIGTGLSMDRFRDTFWYYIMRVNNQ